MPSPSPLTAPGAVLVSPTPGLVLRPGIVWPTLGPSYPTAGPLGMLAVAFAYFALGVAVGALLKQSPRGRRWLPLLVIPGLLAGVGFLMWVIRSLM